MNRLLHNSRKFHLYGRAICLIVVATADSLSAQPSRRALFKGKDLGGWQQVGPGSFVVQDGTMKTEGGMGMLWYAREKIGRAVRVAFKLTAKESDSGVSMRIPEKPTEPWMPINRGYEVEIGTGPTTIRTRACSTHLQKLWRARSNQSANGTRWTSPLMDRIQSCTSTP